MTIPFSAVNGLQTHCILATQATGQDQTTRIEFRKLKNHMKRKEKLNKYLVSIYSITKEKVSCTIKPLNINWVYNIWSRFQSSCDCPDRLNYWTQIPLSFIYLPCVHLPCDALNSCIHANKMFKFIQWWFSCTFSSPLPTIFLVLFKWARLLL